jgi:hypothetical protein
MFDPYDPRHYRCHGRLRDERGRFDPPRGVRQSASMVATLKQFSAETNEALAMTAISVPSG